VNTLAIGGPCKLCGRPNIEHGHGHCPPAVQWVADGVARVKARLVADPEMAKALLPNMTHAEVKAALQKRPAPHPQTLLGHKHAEMTDAYRDDRGLSAGQWKRVAVPATNEPTAAEADPCAS